MHSTTDGHDTRAQFAAHHPDVTDGGINAELIRQPAIARQACLLARKPLLSRLRHPDAVKGGVRALPCLAQGAIGQRAERDTRALVASDSRVARLADPEFLPMPLP
jgi:hypothetical protein